MTEAEWLTSTNPAALLDYLVPREGRNPHRTRMNHPSCSDRKLRLFACACCRLWNTYRNHGDLDEALNRYEMNGNPLFPRPEEWAENRALGISLAEDSAEIATRAALLRDIFGNPWRQDLILHDELRPWLRWHDGLIHALARTIYDEHRFLDMPILADALEEAGCQDEDILRHCRGFRKCEVCLGTREECLCIDGWWLDATEHVRGCWVLDLILGLEDVHSLQCV